jgi:hypothetical protein
MGNVTDRHGRRALKWLALGSIVAALTLTVDAGAQGMRRGGGGGASRDSPNATRDRARDPATSQAPEPYSALEHELPSLGVDLLLNERQLGLWRAFERDVRDLAELDRAQRRHLMSLRQAGEGPRDATTLIGSLAEDERMKSDAAADLKRDLAALYAMLEDNQKRTLDRRVVQSQTDPLGR